MMFAAILLAAAAWTPHPSDGVEMHLSDDRGALRVDFDFHGHAGYAIARQRIDLDLPENYQFVWRIRGDAPPENLEFKLLHGDDVWWMNRRDFVFPREWTTLKTKKRQIGFAWGPAGGGEIRHADSMEIVVTAGSGGHGTVWIDQLHLEPLPVVSNEPQHFTTSTIDLGSTREVGGLEIDWAKLPRHFTVTIDGVPQAHGPTRFVWLPDTDAKTIRIDGGEVRGVTVEPPSWAPTRNDFFAIVARVAKRGDYPRYLAGEQPYWTVVGADGDDAEALVGEDANIEPFKGGFSIEPFLFVNGSLVTWAGAEERQSLADGYLPIPSVQWKRGGITLTTTAAVSDAGTLAIKYRVRGDKPEHVTLYVALRPFQVNPSTQFLNAPGGAASPSACRTCVHPLTKPSAYGAASFDDDLVAHYLRRNALPHAKSVRDDYGSSAWAFPLRLKRGEWHEVVFVVPLHEGAPLRADFSAASWREKLNRVTLDLPPRIANTLRSSLAYILIHRDGAALQPGSRAYERSWIRDGALMAPVLLRLGHANEAKEFARWFATYQFPDGKVPCCVDRRGADPVPENDSHGEFIFLVAEIYRYTHDVEFVRSLWPHVDAAARYINGLRRANHGIYEGLVTESISHEGYSAKPVHSYWDDFFALAGLEDASMLADAIGLPSPAGGYRDQAAIMRRDLAASIAHTIELHHLDYVPGSAELGDFDPSATAIAVAPLGLASVLPPAQLANTFARYLRTPHGEVWTPYEMRIIDALIRRGDPVDAGRLIEQFLEDQRPRGWNEWAEVVGRDERAPRFIGDMPHAWIASDFVRSVLDAIAYQGDDGKLVVGAGVPKSWLPIHVGPLPTYEGPVDVRIDEQGHVTLTHVN